MLSLEDFGVVTISSLHASSNTTLYDTVSDHFLVRAHPSTSVSPYLGMEGLFLDNYTRELHVQTEL